MPQHDLPPLGQRPEGRSEQGGLVDLVDQVADGGLVGGVGEVVDQQVAGLRPEQVHGLVPHGHVQVGAEGDLGSVAADDGAEDVGEGLRHDVVGPIGTRQLARDTERGLPVTPEQGPLRLEGAVAREVDQSLVVEQLVGLAGGGVEHTWKT
nr:hypothetical protein [Aeromicrobium marinum]